MPTTYVEAIREGIREEMERDPNVFLLGEDIGVYGGAFKVTQGLLDQFGERRIVDTPISESAIVGAEFTGTSISSSGDGADVRPGIDKLYSKNPHLQFYNGQRGYVRCTVTPDKWLTDYRVVPFVSKPDAPLSTRASFVVENGRPGAKKA